MVDDKAKKVLFDVVRAMFSPIFIEEVFKPQDMYTIASTKQIFENPKDERTNDYVNGRFG